jgi:hypothetical protein
MSTSPAAFAELLRSAVEDPGIISRAYSAFHGYSIGNQILALVQCAERGIAPGPMATFVGWKDKGRHVRKGEKAITLCQPVTIKRTAEQKDHTDTTEAFTRFIYRPRWFAELQPAPTTPAWNQVRALDTLAVTEEPFTPRWTPENRPSIDTSKPATTGVATETVSC